MFYPELKFHKEIYAVRYPWWNVLTMEGPVLRKVAFCIFSAIIFFLQINVVSCKPKWVHVVKSCPMANNLTDWIRASDELRCIHSLTSKDSAEQSHVYHCLPSSFLNETVEFCGKSVPVEKGNCPVYTYAFGDNISPNARICTNFSKGCPKKLYFSKSSYLYSECLNVNKRCRCYRADSTCTEDCRGPDIELANRSTKDIAEHTTSRPVSESVTNDIIIVLPVCFALIALGLAIAIVYNINRQRVNMSNRYEGTKRVGFSTNDETVMLREGDENSQNPTLEERKDDGIKHFPLHDLLCSIGKKLTEESIEKFSFHLNAQKRSTDHQRINGLSNGGDVLLRMHEMYDFNLNIFLLEAFLDKAKEEALKRRCIDFAKNNNRIYYTKGNVCGKGYRELILNLNRNIDEFSDGEIDKMRKELSCIMQMKDPEDILLKEISKGSVLVHFLIKKKYLTVAWDCNFSILKKYGLQEITLNGKCIYPEENRDEPLDYSDSTLLEQDEPNPKIYLSEV